MRHYLPDEFDNGDPMVDRTFAFTILNSLEPLYFPHHLKKIEEERIRQGKNAVNDVIKVKPELLSLLEAFGQTKSNVSGRQTSGRGLSMLKKNSKKRKRTSKEAQGDEEAEIPDGLASKRKRV